MILSMLGPNEQTPRSDTGNMPDKGAKQPQQLKLPPPAWSIWEVVMVLAIGVALSLLPFLFQGSARNTVGLNMVSGFLQDGAFFLVPCLLVLNKYKQPAALLGMFRVQTVKALLVGVPAGLLCYGAMAVTAYLVQLVFPGIINSGQSGMALLTMAGNTFELVMVSIFICVMSPFGEEMLFRAFAYPPLVMRLGRGPAILITALAFAAMHLNLATFFPLFIGGLGFGLLYNTFRNLWINICAHMTWNVLVLILYFTL